MAKNGNGDSTELPDIKTKTILEDDEESKNGSNKYGRKRGISQYSRRKLQITNRVRDLGKPRRKVFCINTYPSRSELETLQHIIEKNDWEERLGPMEGHLIWYGLPLRESKLVVWFILMLNIGDMKLLQRRPNVIFNKYPGSDYL